MDNNIIPLKIVLIGDPEVGKTTLRKRFMGEGFKENYLPTIGVDFAFKEVSMGKKGTFQLQIWDIGSQVLFHRIRKTYYRSTYGAIILADITKPKSFMNIDAWAKELWSTNDLGLVPTIIIGNKIDLRKDFHDAVTPSDGEFCAAELSEISRKEGGFSVPYFETCAKTGYNVDEAFEQLVILMLNHFDIVYSKSPSIIDSQEKSQLMTLPSQEL